MKSTKCVVGFVALGSMIAGNPIIAKADEIEKKPDLTVNVETSQESYAKEADIDLSLDFINNSEEFNLKDVDVTGTNVGDRYVLEGTTKINLEVGEEKKIEGVVLRSIKASEVNPSDSPSTGDEENLMIVGVIVIGSALCVALARKNKKGLMATVVLGAIVATGIAGSGITAYAEETKQETIIVTKEIVVDGQPLTIELTIGYIKEKAPKQDPVVTEDPTVELEKLSAERESLMRSYIAGEVSEEDYQAKLAEMYAKQDELDEKKELADLPRLEDGSLDLYNIDPSKFCYESTFNAYNDELAKWYEQGKIDKDIYDGTVSAVNDILTNLAEKKALKEEQDKLRIDSSLEAIKQKMEQERIEAEQKAEEERLKQEEIKARGELYNLDVFELYNLLEEIIHEGNTSYTEDQIKQELSYKFRDKEVVNYDKFKTFEEYYNWVSTDVVETYYVDRHPYMPERLTISALPKDMSSPQLQNVNWEATNKINEKFTGLAKESNINYFVENQKSGVNMMYVAVYNWVYANVKDSKYLGTYKSGVRNVSAKDYSYWDWGVSLNDYNNMSIDDLITEYHKAALGSRVDGCCIIVYNSNGILVFRTYGYSY